MGLVIRRGHVTSFVARHQLAWDLAMAGLTVVYVALAFSEDTLSGPGRYVLWGLAVVFLAEFAARCYDAKDRVRYLYGHWLDLVTAIPVPGVPGLRVIRLLRVLRFIKVGVIVRKLLLERGFSEFGSRPGAHDCAIREAHRVDH